ncbi:MAG: hypothetical protein Q9167_002817 [Letrouitia subvulpina]
MKVNSLDSPTDYRSGYPNFPSYTLSFYGHDTQQYREPSTTQLRNQASPHASWKPAKTQDILGLKERFSHQPINKKKRPHNALKKGLKPTWRADLPPRNKVNRKLSNRPLGVSSTSRGLTGKNETQGEVTTTTPIFCASGGNTPSTTTALLHTVRSTRSLLPPPDESARSPVLSQYKQNHTKLRIYIGNNSNTFVPVKLRSCNTIDIFFATVARACDLEPDNLKAVRVDFDWIQENEKKGVMAIRKDIEDSFEIFLESVNDASCWGDESGDCAVGVVIWK